MLSPPLCGDGGRFASGQVIRGYLAKAQTPVPFRVMEVPSPTTLDYNDQGIRRPRNYSAALRVVNWLTVLGAALLLLLSLWPGFIVGCFLVLAYPLIFGLGLMWLVLVYLGTRAKAHSPLGARAVLVAPVVVCMTYASLRYYVPRRIAFAACRGQFEKHLAAAQAGTPSAPAWMGIYRVDECRADERGGVYFRTGTTADGIGPDTLSYGFAYKPNTNGSPFGAARYRAYPLLGDWYWFQASNDWH